MSEQAVVRAETPVFAGRLAIGLVQGLALYLLYLAFDDKVWPATDGLLFAPLVAVALFVPLLVIQAMGNIRAATLVIWTLIATLAAAGFAFYDIWHGWPTETKFLTDHFADVPRLLPAAETFFFSAVFLFIAQALIVSGDSDRKFVAQYQTQFDIAWKQGLQIALAGIFVGLFWLLLFLGAELFQLIKLDFLQKLIEHRWFAIPATTLAIATAFHITDLRSSLVRGARNLVLALFSWLLLLIALIAAGFLVALLFTGLAPLWGTRMATSLLLLAAASLVVLINAVYQGGDENHRAVAVLRWACRLGGILLVPIVALAGYALALRIGQYGWSADRILALASVAVAATYAVGYAIAALWPKPWFKPLERWNFWAALLVLVVIGALLSPLADPARISVASQVARLDTGKVTADKFDFYYLHREGGRFGKAALENLSRSKDPVVAHSAKDALAGTSPWSIPAHPTPVSVRELVQVFPAGRKMPESFAREDWTQVFKGYSLPDCLAGRTGNIQHCTVLFTDLNGDGSEDAILFRAGDSGFDRIWGAEILHFDGTHWRQTGNIEGTWFCPQDRAALLAGNFKAIPADAVPPDLMVNGHRIRTGRALAAPDCK